MNWILNLMTGSPWDLFILMGFPCLAVCALVGFFLGLCAIYDNIYWRKYRNERVSLFRRGLRRTRNFLRRNGARLIHHRKTI